jgi:prophage maintenance system killer protein
MYELTSMKDIIAINQLFDEGGLVNPGSLDFAIEASNREKSWLKATAIIVRAVLIDHAFEEGNKRTAAAIIMGSFEEQALLYDRDKVSKGVVLILRKNITSIEKIQKVIKDAIRT